MRVSVHMYSCLSVTRLCALTMWQAWVQAPSSEQREGHQVPALGGSVGLGGRCVWGFGLEGRREHPPGSGRM